MSNNDVNNYFKNMRASIEQFAKLENDDWEFIKSHYELKQYKKGEKILAPGERADIIFFIGKGLVKRFFICHDGRQFITSLDIENRIVSDFVSLIENKPSKIYIEALEDCEVLVSCYGISNLLFERSSIWEEIGRKITEYRYVEKSKREYELLHYDTLDRYDNFRNGNPELFNRITQRDTASYLGVTPESLSRLLRKRKM